MMVKFPPSPPSLILSICKVLASMDCGGVSTCRFAFQIMAVPGFPLSSKLLSALYPCLFTISFNSVVFSTFSWRHNTFGLNLLNRSITFSLLLPPTLCETALNGGVDPPGPGPPRCWEKGRGREVSLVVVAIVTARSTIIIRLPMMAFVRGVVLSTLAQLILLPLPGLGLLLPLSLLAG